ncbi:MAG: methyltransferase [Bacteroidales bacterium]
MRKPFQFKQFNLMDEKSAMKLSTDAVLLGSLIQPVKTGFVLDIGTGSGIISLMIAQQSDTVIDAIDIDPDSIEEARLNFQNSKWKSQLNAVHCSLKDFVNTSSKQYDLVVSNPPYFSNSFKSPDLSRTISKHNDQLSRHELLHGADQHLHPQGSFWVIIPFDGVSSFSELAKSAGLYLQQEFVIFPKRNKPANRVVMEFRKNKPKEIESKKLIIRNLNGSYTNKYKMVTKDFYLKF